MRPAVCRIRASAFSAAISAGLKLRTAPLPDFSRFCLPLRKVVPAVQVCAFDKRLGKCGMVVLRVSEMFPFRQRREIRALRDEFRLQRRRTAPPYPSLTMVGMLEIDGDLRPRRVCKARIVIISGGPGAALAVETVHQSSS